MDRGDALLLLKEMEKADGLDVDVMELKWWQEHFPEVPERIIKKVVSPVEPWDPAALPWNRHQRRAHQKRGVALHLFSGPNVKKWKDCEVGGLEWIFVDTCLGSQFDLHRPAVWSYLWGLANQGLIKLILGGPPCRSVSRLRDGPPGPRRVRGRGPERYGLEKLEPEEIELVEGDTCLLLKQIGLWKKAEQVRGEQGLETGYLFETPQDPASYVPDEEGREQPSFLEFPEVRALVEDYGMKLVTFDQGRTGHERRKPTSLVTNLPGMEQLHGLRGGGSTEGVGADLSERIRSSKTWAAWSPGLVAAIQESLKIRTQIIREMAEQDQMEMKKMDLSAWKRHVQMQHRPYRRDCRRCLEMMGSDGHHRRTAGDRASYCLTMDIVGPMPVGDDVGTGEKSKYMMVSTIAIPRIPLEGDPQGPPDMVEDESLPKLEAEEDEPVERATDEEVKHSTSDGWSM